MPEIFVIVLRAILADYADRASSAFRVIDFGFRLNAEEQRRRYLIQSLFLAEGLSLASDRQRFDREVHADSCEIEDLESHGLATASAGRMQLTAAGLERSDVIGPWLYTGPVADLMADH